MATVNAEVAHHKTPISTQIWLLIIATFLLRVGFGAILVIFDWTLVWGIELSLGVAAHSSVESILLTSFAAITYLIAEIMLTGYYGNKSDRIGARPVVLWATFGSMFVVLLYTPASIVYRFSYQAHPYTGILMLTAFLALIHFIHGIFAAAKVAPTLGFINHHSDLSNRTLHMSYYDNAILYGRAGGMILGGLLWVAFGVDGTKNLTVQSELISATYLPLAVLLLIATLLIYWGIEDIPKKDVPNKFSLKKDMKIAYSVMMEKDRRHLLLPWISIAALIGSASVWGPSVAFRVAGSSNAHSNSRGLEAILPIMFILVALALPAPLWGWYADRHDKFRTMKIGLFGSPIFLVIGLAVGFPFYRAGLLSKQASIISNIPFLLSLVPSIFFFSAFIPVLMGSLGETAKDGEKEDGHVMSGYHFVIASGEIIGILGGGLFIGFFALLNFLGVIHNADLALLVGFVLFELLLVAGLVFGILKLPSHTLKKEPSINSEKEPVIGTD